MRTLTGAGRKLRRIGISILTIGFLVAGWATARAESAAGGPAVTATTDEQRIEWQPQIPVEKTMLRVWGEGKLIEADFEAGTTPSFDLRDRRGKPVPDGRYNYRLTVVPELAGDDRGRLAQVRAQVDADAVGGTRQQGPFLVGGTFSVRGGVLVEHELRREQVPHDRPLAPSVKSGGDLSLWGDLTVLGIAGVVARDPEGGRRSVHYAALSGPEVGTYYRGSAKLAGGEAVIELPAHFAKLTEERGLTVQLTPVGAWSRLYVAEKSRERLVVRQTEGDGEAEFDFLVQGVRSGYAGFAVEREADPWLFPELR